MGKGVEFPIDLNSLHQLKEPQPAGYQKKVHLLSEPAAALHSRHTAQRLGSPNMPFFLPMEWPRFGGSTELWFTQISMLRVFSIVFLMLWDRVSLLSSPLPPICTWGSLIKPGWPCIYFLGSVCPYFLAWVTEPSFWCECRGSKLRSHNWSLSLFYLPFCQELMEPGCSQTCQVVKDGLKLLLLLPLPSRCWDYRWCMLGKHPTS